MPPRPRRPHLLPPLTSPPFPQRFEHEGALLDVAEIGGASRDPLVTADVVKVPEGDGYMVLQRLVPAHVNRDPQLLVPIRVPENMSRKI